MAGGARPAGATIGDIRGLLTATLPILVGSASDALAQREPVTDRDYAIDLYQGGVIGSGRIIGMGGASVAVGEGSAGMMFNPAAAAVRPATSNDRWDWDWHLDWLIPGPGTDHDNNGDATTEIDNTSVITVGVVGLYREWALGLGLNLEGHDFPIGATDEGTSQIVLGKLILARTFWGNRLTVGAGFRYGTFSMSRVSGTETTDLFSITGESFEVGAIWRPIDRDLRVGATVAFPVTGEEITTETCDPMNCDGYILPDRVAVPWQLSAGLGWRKAPTRWNRQIHDDWRDEKALTVAGDVVITGAVEDGSGVEAFVDHELQPSGRSVNVSVRAGADYEWVPGRLRIRAGSYWEPGRFEGESGRIHLTGGLEWRFWSFCFWDDRYRLRLSLTVDGASRYGNGGVSVGLWH